MSSVLPVLVEKFSSLTKDIENDKFGPVKYFGRISRSVKFTGEILSWYNFVRSTSYHKPNPDPKRDFKDHQERMSHYLRDCFIEILSSIDYQSKEQLRTTKKQEFEKLKENLKNGKYVFLSKIIDAASNRNLLTQEETKYWNYIIHIRNCLVHNAGKSDKDFENLISELTVKKDEWIEGRPTDFYDLIEKTVSLYSNWIKIL